MSNSYSDPQVERFMRDAEAQVRDKGLEATPQAAFLTGIAWLDKRNEARQERALGFSTKSRRRQFVEKGAPGGIFAGIGSAIGAAVIVVVQWMKGQ